MISDDDSLDEHLPLGDRTADTTGVVICPFCGEHNEIALDPGSGTAQEYVEDCHVCCRSWLVHVRYRPDGSADVVLDAAEGE